MLAHISFILLQITRLTDGRTDGRTDTFLVASPCWHSMQRGKNVQARILEKVDNIKPKNQITQSRIIAIVAKIAMLYNAMQCKNRLPMF